MEAFFNLGKNQYIIAPNRAGTSFLNSSAVRSLGWKKTKIPTMRLNSEMTIVKVIRNPYERWNSWFDNFILADDTSSWPLDRAIAWADEFEKTLGNDPHTQRQSILLNSIKSGPEQTKYLQMEDINLFIGTSSQRHELTPRVRYSTLPATTVAFLNYKIKKIYSDDYNWIKNLQVLTF